MSPTASISSAPAPALAARESVRGAVIPAAVGVLAAGITLTIHGAHDLREVVVVSAALVLVVGIAFGLVIPRALRHDSGATAALTMSVLGALLLLPAFWSALPLALGVAGALLGHARRDAHLGAGKAAAAVALGVLTAVGYFVISAWDALDAAQLTWT